MSNGNKDMILSLMLQEWGFSPENSRKAALAALEIAAGTHEEGSVRVLTLEDFVADLKAIREARP